MARSTTTGFLAGAWGRGRRFLAVALAFWLVGPTGGIWGAEPVPPDPPETAAALFGADQPWTVSLEFSPEQWEAIEPVRTAPGEEPSERGSLAAGWMRAGDRDHDGKFTAEEFRALAEAWFGAWDPAGTGRIGNDAVARGLQLVMAPLPGPPTPSGIGWTFNYVHADVDLAGQEFVDAGVRLKGAGSFAATRGSVKRSMKIDLNQFAKGMRLAGMTQFNLHSESTDAGMMNEVLALRMHRDAGVPAPRAVFCRVYLAVTGRQPRRYLGIYTLVEDVGTHFAEDRFGTRFGALFKPVLPGLFADRGSNWLDHAPAYEPRSRLSGAEKLRLMEFVRMIHHADDALFARRLGDFVDLDEFSRYLAVSALLSDQEGILGEGRNLYLFLHPTTHRFSFVPWDQDRAWGRSGGGGGDLARLSLGHPWRGTNRFLERAFTVPAFRNLYEARVREFATNLLEPARIEAQVDAIAARLRPSVAEESAERLAAFDLAVAGERAADARFGRPGRERPVKAFVRERALAVAEQLAGRAAGEVAASIPTPPRNDGLLEGLFFGELDADRDGWVTRAEFAAAFGRWFADWDVTRLGHLTAERLRQGIDHAFVPKTAANAGLRASE